MAKERVLLKFSGENISGEGKNRHSKKTLLSITGEINSVASRYEIAVVVGGGNVVRGSHYKKEVSDRNNITPDLMGMAATIINALALQDFLEGEFNLDTRVMSAQRNEWLCEPYIMRRAVRHLEKGRIVILAGGMGVPNLSTDSTMIMRAEELEIKYVFKGTKVDGIYDRDPRQHPDAHFIPKIGYAEYVQRKLKVVDPNAVNKAEEFNTKIRVFNCFTAGNLERVLRDEGIGSIIS